jgi:hypothetical protein
MDAGLLALIAIGLFALSLAFWPVWFRAWVRHKRTSDPRFIPPSGLGIFDEVYRPATYAATQELKAERRKTDEAGARER